MIAESIDKIVEIIFTPIKLRSGNCFYSDQASCTKLKSLIVLIHSGLAFI